ncbi:MAG: hypothetical protein R2784_14295 [Saprospiraceae bacterium]
MGSGTPVPNNNQYKAFGASGGIYGDTIIYIGGASIGNNFPIAPYIRKARSSIKIILMKLIGVSRWNLLQPDIEVAILKLINILPVGGSKRLTTTTELLMTEAEVLNPSQSKSFTKMV